MFPENFVFLCHTSILGADRETAELRLVDGDPRMLKFGAPQTFLSVTALPSPLPLRS